MIERNVGNAITVKEGREGEKAKRQSKTEEVEESDSEISWKKEREVVAE